MPSSDLTTMPSSDLTSYAFEPLEEVVHVRTGRAEDILSAAWAEAEKVREHARREGEAAGRAEGLAAAREDAERLLSALAEAAAGLDQAREELVSVLEGQAADLALRIAEQILTAAIDVAPERIVDITRGALRRLTDRHRVTIAVNPLDLELLSAATPALKQELGGIEHVDVQADRRVDRGGALVRTAWGEVDATISAQLESAREIVAAALGDDAEPPEATDPDDELPDRH
jgi:flagellar assembly protein FliH